MGIFLTATTTSTALEYILGRFIFKAGKYGGSPNATKSHDYRDQPFNYEGVITLKNSIIWGFSGIVIVKSFPTLFKSVQAGLIEAGVEK